MTDICGQTADNKHTGSMIFPFFSSSVQYKPLGDFSVSKTHLADRSFPLYGSLNNRKKQINCFLLFSFQAEIDAFSF